MGNPFVAIGRWLKKAFGLVDRVAEAIERASKAALPIVEMVAKLTPTRADDELIALFKINGLANLEAYLALPIEQRGAALLEAATQLLKRQFPNLPTEQLQAAVQLALVLYRESLQGK